VTELCEQIQFWLELFFEALAKFIADPFGELIEGWY